MTTTFFQHGDEPDAAFFAQAFGVNARTDFIVQGFSFTVDLTALTLDVASGVGAVQRGFFDTASSDLLSQKTMESAAHPVQKDSENGLALTDNVVNHVYLDVDITQDDNQLFVVNTTGSEPSSEAVKLGEVDTNQSTAAEAKSEQWNLIRVDGTLSYPDLASLQASASSFESGTTLYNRGDGILYRVTDAGVEAVIDPSEQQMLSRRNHG